MTDSKLTRIAYWELLGAWARDVLMSFVPTCRNERYSNRQYNQNKPHPRRQYNMKDNIKDEQRYEELERQRLKEREKRDRERMEMRTSGELSREYQNKRRREEREMEGQINERQAENRPSRVTFVPCTLQLRQLNALKFKHRLSLIIFPKSFK